MYSKFSRGRWDKQKKDSNNNSNSESQQMNATNFERIGSCTWCRRTGDHYFSSLEQNMCDFFSYPYWVIRPSFRLIVDSIRKNNNIRCDQHISYGHFWIYIYIYVKYAIYLKQIKECHVYVCPKTIKSRLIWYWINIHWEFVEFMNLIEITSCVQYYNTHINSAVNLLFFFFIRFDSLFLPDRMSNC